MIVVFSHENELPTKKKDDDEMTNCLSWGQSNPMCHRLTCCAQSANVLFVSISICYRKQNDNYFRFTKIQYEIVENELGRGVYRVKSIKWNVQQCSIHASCARVCVCGSLQGFAMTKKKTRKDFNRRASGFFPFYFG